MPAQRLRRQKKLTIWNLRTKLRLCCIQCLSRQCELEMSKRQKANVKSTPNGRTCTTPLFGYICIADYYLVCGNNRGTCIHPVARKSYENHSHRSSYSASFLQAPQPSVIPHSLLLSKLQLGSELSLPADMRGRVPHTARRSSVAARIHLLPS
jgi:hypothetical protein